MHNGIADALAKKKLEPTPIDSSFAELSQDMPNSKITLYILLFILSFCKSQNSAPVKLNDKNHRLKHCHMAKFKRLFTP
ncbi:hypothetical protein [uncultured Treponema sp.]|uniref:hypothetical protein n=1 Tax=uncultured Treponema sp. TaxID=162155 RepID=UPI0025F6EB51|nr:hypothetical protein [uncultured Treponema sp.]